MIGRCLIKFESSEQVDLGAFCLFVYAVAMIRPSEYPDISSVFQKCLQKIEPLQIARLYHPSSHLLTKADSRKAMQRQLSKIQVNQLLIALKLMQLHTGPENLLSESQTLLSRLVHNYTQALPAQRLSSGSYNKSIFENDLLTVLTQYLFTDCLVEAEKSLIPPFHCDFYVDKHALVLEANGMQHYKQTGGLTNTYELFRQLYRQEGFRVVHFDF